LLCTEDDNSCYRNVCKMSVVSFALAVVFIIQCTSLWNYVDSLIGVNWSAALPYSV